MSENHFFTVPSSFDSSSSGYIAVAPLSGECKDRIYDIQKKINSYFSSDEIWFPKNKQLHITFAHVISPDSTYQSDIDILFKSLKDDVQNSLKDITSSTHPIDVNFNKIRVFEPSIILQGFDNGTFENIRNKFINGFNLPDESRKPPNIIHVSIARFRKKKDIFKIKGLIEDLNVNFTEKILSLELIHETKIYVQNQRKISGYIFK